MKGRSLGVDSRSSNCSEGRSYALVLLLLMMMVKKESKDIPVTGHGGP
jgi:hypothetical protein